MPSLTLEQAELAKLSGPSFYEERLLFLLTRLRNPNDRTIDVLDHETHFRAPGCPPRRSDA